MPSMANITVKNAANADVVLTAAVPSAGDRSPARWTANAASSVIGFRPIFETVTRSNGNGNARIMDVSMSYPITKVVNGETVLAAKEIASASFILPTNVDSALVNDGFVQFGNFVASTLVRAAAAEGYAPT